jgi:hypothetical protein
MKPFLVPLLAALAGTSSFGASCDARSGALAPVVVELYTSEGCNSCPPADRWLSSLKGRPDVVALAFHVDYWDRLGWVDRFASRAYTERQQLRQPGSGARFIYTPQVLAGGQDWRRWQSALPPRQPSAVQLTLTKVGTRVQAHVEPHSGAPSDLAGFWAVVEHGQVSVVKAGENEGATLRHDHVVRDYRPVPAWRGKATLDRESPAPGQEVVFVVEDANTGRPLQALALAC